MKLGKGVNELSKARDQAWIRHTVFEPLCMLHFNNV